MPLGKRATRRRLSRHNSRSTHGRLKRKGRRHAVGCDWSLSREVRVFVHREGKRETRRVALEATGAPFRAARSPDPCRSCAQAPRQFRCGGGPPMCGQLPEVGKVRNLAMQGRWRDVTQSGQVLERRILGVLDGLHPRPVGPVEMTAAAAKISGTASREGVKASKSRQNLLSSISQAPL